MAAFIELTQDDSQKVIINIDTIKCITSKAGGIDITLKDEDTHSHSFTESYEELKGALRILTSRPVFEISSSGNERGLLML